MDDHKLIHPMYTILLPAQFNSLQVACINQAGPNPTVSVRSEPNGRGDHRLRLLSEAQFYAILDNRLYEARRKKGAA